MHDLSLGGPVDIGAYDGPIVDGKPLHSGNCEDGVYGCRMCETAARRLTPEQRKELGYSETGTCDWCKKTVPFETLAFQTDADEGCSVVYEVCRPCRDKYNESMREEIASMRQDEDWD